MEGAVQQDSATAEMVVQAQEALLRNESLSLSTPFLCVLYNRILVYVSLFLSL